jgi:hypothetical protein
MSHLTMTHHPLSIYCCSDDCKEHFPGNTAADFRVHLGETLHIPPHWVCALVDIKIPDSLTSTTYLCCDLCDSSLTGSSGRLPILRRVPINWSSLLPLVYVPVKKDVFNTIQFYLRDNNGRPLSNISGRLECTLLLKPDTPWTT